LTYLVSHIAPIIGAEPVIRQDTGIDQLLTDSRKIVAPATSLFFALQSDRRNGHQFIPELYKKGVWNFVVSEQVDSSEFVC
jgi:UDP-N-acetylmuramyl pentapeptide synthase